MARLDEYVFGYEKGNAEPCDAIRVANAMLHLGMCSEISPSGKFTLRHRDRSRFLAYARARVRFALSDTLGLYGFLLGLRHRYGLISAFLIASLILILTRTLVWDVRISGNFSLPESAVEETLSESGLAVGTPWRRVDVGTIEATLLSTHPEIAWISVNRRGTVAYIELIESENVGYSEDIAPLYSNIVADRDGVIEEITVKSGEAVVKVGDVVRAGDVLISGIIQNEGGVRFCRAQGEVRAHSVTDITAEVYRNVTERIETGRHLHQARVIIFNFSINIFKNYGNCENTCDIIEETKDFSLFGRYKLPILLKRTYSYEYTEHQLSLADDEMIAIAKSTLDDKMRQELQHADVIKLRSEGGFSGDVYRITTRVVYSSEIGRESEIEIS